MANVERTNSTPQPGEQVCPVCKVKIIAGGMLGDRVLFAVGPATTRDVLWQRVCRYAQQSGCINASGGAGASGR